MKYAHVRAKLHFAADFGYHESTQLLMFGSWSTDGDYFIVHVCVQGITFDTEKIIDLDKDGIMNIFIALTHLPITRMRNRDQYRMSIRGVSGLALEE